MIHNSIIPELKIRAQFNPKPPIRKKKIMELYLPTTIFFIILFFNFLQFHKSAYGNDEKYDECRKTFQCGNTTFLSYPFYDGENRPSYCGYPGFQIDCSNTMPQIYMSSETFYILNMEPNSNNISVAWQSYWDDLCPQNLFNASINLNLYKYTSGDDNATLLYNCNISSSWKENQITCKNVSYPPVGYIMNQDLESFKATNLCPNFNLVLVPVLHSLRGSITDQGTLKEALKNGFELEWIAENKLCDGCRESGGECGYDKNMANFTCYCHDRPYESKCSSIGDGSTHHKLSRTAKGIIACLGIAIGISMLVFLAYYIKRRCSKNNEDIDAILKKYGPLALERYTYRSLKKVTNSFKDKLGQGGYGVVYKGELSDGRLVAVKRLKDAKGNADDFINELRSIGRTNHVNVVMLLGFCFEGKKRALVYAFMPRGSLDRFIKERNNYQSLPWDPIYNISVGIAKGLQYLHQGCNTRIVHFDIKPHNILLDEDLCPKIADFGLAKLCKQNVSIISMSEARGTIGFIAPEVYRRSFGVVSYKSDVYSYGMLVLEMIGCRRNVSADVRHSTEYFPDWIYNQLEQTEEIGHREIVYGEENGTIRKMILVSLWCIQTDPSRRPQMNRVVEMLEGPLESLQIPPRPSLSPPQISHRNSPTTTTTTETTIPVQNWSL